MNLESELQKALVLKEAGFISYKRIVARCKIHAMKNDSPHNKDLVDKYFEKLGESPVKWKPTDEVKKSDTDVQDKP